MACQLKKHQIRKREKKKKKDNNNNKKGENTHFFPTRNNPHAHHIYAYTHTTNIVYIGYKYVQIYVRN